MKITPAQCRAARALLDWRQPDLAAASEVSEVTIRQYESGRTRAQASTLNALKTALENAGVEFTNGDRPGVRLAKR